MKITKTTDWLIVGVLVVTGTVVLWKFYKNRKDPSGDLLSEGESDSAGDSEANRPTATTITEPNWSNPFDLNFMAQVKKWVAPVGISKLKDDYADGLAQQIYKAKGKWIISNDDEQAVENVFARSLKDKVHVSNLANAFYKRYQRPLKPFLESFLSEREMKKYVLQPIMKLDKYSKA